MARVTVEDCVTKVPNRFDLVLYSGHRARQISSGAELLVDRDRDKNPVVALREIADDHLTPEALKEEIIHSEQKYVEVDEPEEDNMEELMNGKMPDMPKQDMFDKGIHQSNLEQDSLDEGDGADIIEPEDE